MKTSESIEKIIPAIHAVQQQAGTIAKTTAGQVGTRSYKYANLNDTWEAVKGLLAQNKLTVIQSPTSGPQTIGQFFETTIYHESGEWIQETMQMTLQRDDPQAIGAAITYYRRYMLTSMLGLIPDDDNDARDHRLATAQQKVRIIGAAKQVYPELAVAKPEVIVATIQNMTGKYPGNIREDEAEDMINLIKSFTARELAEDNENEVSPKKSSGTKSSV
jgi:hypothetical protein